MITTIPEDLEGKKLFDWLVQNKSLLINQKKSVVKHADAVSFYAPLIINDTNTGVVKAEAAAIPDSATKLKVRSIINTTKLYDSHGDVHIDGLWNKSLKETKDNYLVNQHDFSFEGIISDNVHAFAKTYTWKELNADYKGSTQALVYDSVLTKEDAGDMFDRYRKGKVKNHSVGMRYVKLFLAINDDRYREEFDTWEKYFDDIANKDDVEAVGYFWAVTEAKNIEGSAVVRGSNFITPTESVAESKQHIEPDKSTQKASRIKTLVELNKLITLTQNIGK